MKINPSPVFKHTLHLTVPGQDDLAPVAFWFKHKDRDALLAWTAKPVTATQQGQVLTDAAYLGEVIEGWKGPVDDAGAPVVYSSDALGALLLAYPTAANEIYNGYIDALTKSRVKN